MLLSRASALELSALPMPMYSTMYLHATHQAVHALLERCVFRLPGYTCNMWQRTVVHHLAQTPHCIQPFQSQSRRRQPKCSDHSPVLELAHETCLLEESIQVFRLLHNGWLQPLDRHLLHGAHGRCLHYDSMGPERIRMGARDVLVRFILRTQYMLTRTRRLAPPGSPSHSASSTTANAPSPAHMQVSMTQILSKQSAGAAAQHLCCHAEGVIIQFFTWSSHGPCEHKSVHVNLHPNSHLCLHDSPSFFTVVSWLGLTSLTCMGARTRDERSQWHERSRRHERMHMLWILSSTEPPNVFSCCMQALAWLMSRSVLKPPDTITPSLTFDLRSGEHHSYHVLVPSTFSSSTFIPSLCPSSGRLGGWRTSRSRGWVAGLRAGVARVLRISQLHLPQGNSPVQSCIQACHCRKWACRCYCREVAG